MPEGLTDAWVRAVESIPGLAEVPLPGPAARMDAPNGGQWTRLWRGDRLEQATVHEFRSVGKVTEWNMIGVPANGWDFPGVHLVLYQFPGRLHLVADLVPLADVVFQRDYYPRYLDAHREIVARWWKEIVSAASLPDQPPPARAYQQAGSALEISLYLDPSALDVATAFLAEAALGWAAVVAAAEPVGDPALAAAIDLRKDTLFRTFWKAADRQGVAFGIMAEVVGEDLSGQLFDMLWGPLESWHPEYR